MLAPASGKDNSGASMVLRGSPREKVHSSHQQDAACEGSVVFYTQPLVIGGQERDNVRRSRSTTCPTANTDSTDIRIAEKKGGRPASAPATNQLARTHSARVRCRWQLNVQCRAVPSVARYWPQPARFRTSARSAASSCIPASSACISILPAVLSACRLYPSAFRAKTSRTNAPFTPSGSRRRKKPPHQRPPNLRAPGRRSIISSKTNCGLHQGFMVGRRRTSLA